MGDVDVLESVLSKDEALIGGVTPDGASRPTDCPDYDVTRLVDHLVEWMASFAAAAEGSAPADDPAGSAADPTPDPAARFREHAERCVAAWREQGTERTVRFMSSDLPAGAVLAMTLMEFATHGCDLARATDQPVPFTDAELELVLERALVTLPGQYRGEGRPFGPRVDVPDTAPAVDRLRGFMGRTP